MKYSTQVKRYYRQEALGLTPVYHARQEQKIKCQSCGRKVNDGLIVGNGCRFCNGSAHVPVVRGCDGHIHFAVIIPAPHGSQRLCVVCGDVNASVNRVEDRKGATCPNCLAIKTKLSMTMVDNSVNVV